jgi:PAS domain-containing protein
LFSSSLAVSSSFNVPDVLKALPWLSLIKLTAELLVLAAGAWYASKHLRLWLCSVARKFVRNRHTLERLEVLFGPDPAGIIHRTLSHLTLQSAQQALRDAHAPNSLACYICDLSGKCIAVNKALCRIYNRSEPEMLGHGWSSVFETTEEALRIVGLWSASVAQGVPYHASYLIHGVLYKTEAHPVVINGEIKQYWGWVQKADEPKM